MKKIVSIIFLLILNSCSGYEPVFSSKNTNFYLDQINVDNNDKISRILKRKLTPYTNFSKEKKKINIQIKSEKSIRIISKDKKGDPSVYEMLVKVNLKISSDLTDQDEINFIEKFSFNNQTNKFEFDQYKKNIESDLTDKILEKIIVKLRVSG